MTIVTTGRELPPSEYRSMLTDLRTNEIVAEVPLQNIRYSNVLSGWGSLSAEVQANKSTAVYRLRESVRAGEVGLYLFRNGVPVWGGIVWATAYTGPNRSLKVEAKSFESYYYSVKILTSKSWTNTDQFTIARATAALASADMNIANSSNLSGILRTRSIWVYDDKFVGEELEQMSDLIEGFDWNVTLLHPGGTDVDLRLDMWHRHRGVSKDDTTLAFEYPGSISSFTITDDAGAGANRMFALGAGEGEEMVRTSATANPENYPWIDKSFAYKTVVTKPTLQAHANSDLIRLRTPVTIAEVNVRADKEPYLGTYEPGDWARFSFEDDYYTPALALFMRIVGYTVSVSDDGIESVRLITNTERDEEVYGE